MILNNILTGVIAGVVFWFLSRIYFFWTKRHIRRYLKYLDSLLSSMGMKSEKKDIPETLSTLKYILIDYIRYVNKDNFTDQTIKESNERLARESIKYFDNLREHW